MTHRPAIVRVIAVVATGMALLGGCTEVGTVNGARGADEGNNCAPGPTTVQRQASLIRVAAPRASQVSPAAGEAHRRGVLAARMGDYEGALEAFKQAVFLQPDFAEGYRCIGLVQMEIGREDEALRAFQEAIRLAADLAVAYVNMAIVLGKLGRTAEGLRAYREGVRLEPPLARATTGLEQYLMNSRSRQIADPTQRLYFTHYSVLPPAGGNWIIQEQSSEHIALRRVNVGGGRFHTIIASAELMPVPEELQNLDRLQQHIEREHRAETRDPRFTVLDVKVTQVRLGEAGCVRFDGTSEERGSPVAEGRVLILEAHEYFCPSPVTSMVVVKLAYGQRFLEGARPLPFEKELTSFLFGLKFRL